MDKPPSRHQPHYAAGFAELESFTRRLNSTLRLDAVCQVLADGAQAILGADRVAIFLLDRETANVTCVLSQGLTAEYTGAVAGSYRRLPGGDLLHRRFLIIEDALADQRLASLRPLIEQNGFVSMLLVGLRYQDAPIGAFAVYYDTPQHFDRALLELAQTISNQASVAIVNAQSYQQAQRRVAELDRLHRAAVEINGQPDMESALTAITRWAADLLDVEMSYVYLYDAERNELVVRGAWNAPAEHLGRRIKVGEGLSGRVFQRRELQVVSDYESWPGAAPEWKDFAFGTALATPLVYGDEPVGVLTFTDLTKNRVFNEDALRIAGLFALQAAAALTSALLLAESRRRANRLTALQRVTASVTAMLDLKTVLQSVVQELSSAFGYALVSIHRCQGQSLALEAIAGLELQEAPAKTTPWSRGVTGRAARTGSAQFVTDVNSDSDFVSIKPGVLAEAVIPIALDGRVWGVLNVEATEWGVLRAVDVPLLDLFCQQIAVAIRNANNFTEIQQRVAELEGLRRTSLRLASSLDTEQLLTEIAAAVDDLARPRAMKLFVFDPQSGQFRPGATLPASDRRLLSEPWFRPDGITVRAIEQRRPIVIDDASAHPLFGAHPEPLVREWDVKSIAAFPLVRPSGVMGAFTVSYAQQTPISGALERVLSLFADQAAIALENAWLFQLEAKRRELADTLRQLASAINSMMTFEEAATTILEYLAQVVALDSVSILVMEGDTIRVAAYLTRGDVVWTDRQVFQRNELFSSDYVFETGEPLLIPNTMESELWNPNVGRLGIGSWLGFPIIFQGEPLGVLSVDRNQPGSFTPTDIQIVKAFADQAATALASAKLFQAAAERAAENERLREFNENLVRSVEAGILLETADDNIQYVNPRLCDMVGFREEEMVGQPTAMLLSPEMSALVDRKADKRRYGEKGRYEAALLHKDGSELPVLVNATPLFEDGVFSGTLTAFTDISHRKRIEQTLLALNAAAAAVRQADEPQLVYQTIGEKVRKLGLSLFVFTYHPEQQALHLEHAALTGQMDTLWPSGEAGSAQPRFVIALEEMPNLMRPMLTGKAEFLSIPEQAADVLAAERAGVAREAMRQVLTQQHAVIAPVISQKQPKGVFVVLGEDLSEEDLPAFEAFANQTSAALDNALLLAAERRERRRAEALAEVARILNLPLDLHVALSQVMQLLRSVLPYDNSALFFLRDGHMVCELAEGVDAPWWLGKALRVDDFPLLREMSAAMQPLLIPDTRRDARWVGASNTAHLASWIGAPLVADGQLFGMLCVDKAQPGQYSLEHQEVLTTFANQICVAIQRAQHLSDAQQRLRELSSLVELSALLTEASDLSAVLDVVLSRSCQILQARQGAIALARPSSRQLEVAAACGRLPGYMERVNQKSLWLPSDVEPGPHVGEPILVDPQAEEEQQNGLVTAIPLKIAGQLIGLIEVSQSILSAPQQRLLSAVADLAAAAIDKAQLYQDTARAYQELREMDRLKDEIVQNVSHELRTPLTFIKGYVEFLLDGYAGELNADQRQALEIVLDRSDAIARLVNDIVTLKQAELQEMDLQPVALEQIATTCVEGSRKAAEQAGIDIKLDIPPDLPPVLGDANRLGQVFDNLLGNAIKFSPNGGFIHVRLCRVGKAVQVSISDTGIGIPADSLSKIWKRFYQVDGATTRRFAGAGLGLAIVKTIIDAHFGHIWVESELGCGSTFYFTVPICGEPQNG